jgi:hypothetical protein
MCVMSCSNDQELCFLKGFEMGGINGCDEPKSVGNLGTTNYIIYTKRE